MELYLAALDSPNLVNVITLCVLNFHRASGIVSAFIDARFCANRQRFLHYSCSRLGVLGSNGILPVSQV